MTVMEPNAPVTDVDLDTDADTEVVDTSAYGEAATGARSDPSAPAVGAEALATEDFPAQANGHLAAEAPGETTPTPTPRPMTRPFPFPLPYRMASGRYRSRPIGYQLELRVDIDGNRPLRRLSGDYYSSSGAAVSYFGSWTVDAVTIRTSRSHITVVGTARTTWPTTFTVATVTIPRAHLGRPAPAATIQWSTPSGARGARYHCMWESASFRTVELEEDREAGVAPFGSYDTRSLPSGGTARTLSVADAYAEAGLQMLDTGGGNTIGTPSGYLWTNASLHHAMQTHFSRWQERPQYKVWLLHANAHEFGAGLRGIMFDQQGLQRQGCASFYQAISSGSAQHQREQLYVNVHELGHCFNLFHSFHKSYMTPPLPNRPGALSWMNYPSNYNPGSGAPSGAAAFWAAFDFEFDTLELAHLRHGFRNAVIMGGNPFGTGAALEVGEEFLDRVSDTSGLRLAIAPSDPRPLLGMPVVLNITLTAERTQLVHRREQLHPKYGFVHLAVSRPGGDVVVYQPPVQHCADPALVTSGHDDVQPISAYIGYDAAVGQLFDDPGTYRIRASYAAPDGTMLVSATTTLRVVPPRTSSDDRVAELLLRDQAGMALTLLGSDSPYLADGTNALETVVAEHSEHPAAVFARLALGTNAARPFAEVDATGSVRMRERDLARADELLGAAVNASRGDSGLDDLTVYETLGYLAGSHEAEGDTKKARKLRHDAATMAESKHAPTSVLRSLQE